MRKLKQGVAAIALVASLGLIVPGSFGGPAAADISRTWNLQPMKITCDLDRNPSTGENGFEYVSEVNSADKEFQNHHTTGFKVFKWGTLQDVNNSLVFSVQSATATEILTAVENLGSETEPTDDDTSPQSRVELLSGDLPAGYPVSFVIPPDHANSYFDVGGISLGNKANKKNLIDCEFIDEGIANVDIDGDGKVDEESNCYIEGVPQPLCYQNTFVAGSSDALAAIPCDRSDGGDPTKCFVAGVAYHYTDIISGKFHVSGSSGAKVKSASVDDDETAAERKAKKGGKQRGKGKRGR
jgi:hypothetical protein